MPVAGHALHSHFVAGQRARLVGTDHRHRPQRFHRRQTPDDRVASGHALHAQRQGDGHDCRQSFGDRRSGQSHHQHEHFRRAVVAPQGSEHKRCRRHAQNGQGQDPAETIHLTQQGRGQAADARQHLIDLAQLGGGAGGHDNTAGLPIDHQRARVGHAVAVAQRGIGGHGLSGFFNG
ncbi:hypothetical protein D9M68_636550 [compost metagenome]